MTSRNDKLARRRILTALALRAKSAGASHADLADLAAFVDGSRPLDAATRARVMRVLAQDPGAWRVWRQALAATAASAAGLAVPAPDSKSAQTRQASGTGGAWSWLARLRHVLGIDLMIAVPVFASFLLVVAVGVRNVVADREESNALDALTALIDQQVPDLAQVRSGLASAMAVAQSTRLVNKGLDARTDDSKTLGFDFGLRAAAGALGATDDAMTPQPACAHEECSPFITVGQTFGVWAFSTIVRCAPDAPASRLDFSRQSLTELRATHDAWRKQGALPLDLQAPPAESATQREICNYAGVVVDRVLR